MEVEQSHCPNLKLSVHPSVYHHSRHMSRKSPPLRQVWEPLAGGSLLFFPLTHAPDRDAQKAGGHKHQPTANTSAGGSSGGSDRTRPPVQFDTNAAIALAFLLGSATALGASSVYRRFFRRIKNAEWITPDLLGGKRWITGIVTRCVLCDPASPRSIPNSSLPAHWRWAALASASLLRSVGDADNFRLYHTPGFGWRGLLKFRHVPSTTRGARSPNSTPTSAVLNR